MSLFQLRVLGMAVQSLLLHKLRSLLTILGVVFGVGSVVSLLAVGEGASDEVRQQLLRLGPDRIIIRSARPEHLSGSGEILTYGLTSLDLLRIRTLVPGIAAIAHTYEIKKDFWSGQRRDKVRVIGTTPDFQQVHRLEIGQGRFLAWSDLPRQANVAVLGATAARELFGVDDPIGKDIEHSSGQYRVVGVLRPRIEHSSAHYDPNESVFIPFSTVKSRFENVIRVEEGGSKRYERLALHQIGLRVANLAHMPQIASMIRRLLTRFHPKQDYELVVPFELLQRTERTKRVFNTVLGLIGGISLLVGGIGIMNIMLATVTERTREIGIRRALGATRKAITVQFLVESTVLSAVGGLLGLGLGLLVPLAVSHLFGVKTIVTLGSLVLSLAISLTVGIVFGVYPAHKAAAMEPVVALRHS